jgi:hypothetical protein
LGEGDPRCDHSGGGGAEPSGGCQCPVTRAGC